MQLNDLRPSPYDKCHTHDPQLTHLNVIEGARLLHVLKLGP